MHASQNLLALFRTCNSSIETRWICCREKVWRQIRRTDSPASAFVPEDFRHRRVPTGITERLVTSWPADIMLHIKQTVNNHADDYYQYFNARFSCMLPVNSPSEVRKIHSNLSWFGKHAKRGVKSSRLYFLRVLLLVFQVFRMSTLRVLLLRAPAFQ